MDAALVQGTAPWFAKAVSHVETSQWLLHTQSPLASGAAFYSACYFCWVEDSATHLWQSWGGRQRTEVGEMINQIMLSRALCVFCLPQQKLLNPPPARTGKAST